MTFLSPGLFNSFSEQNLCWIKTGSRETGGYLWLLSLTSIATARNLEHCTTSLFLKKKKPVSIFKKRKQNWMIKKITLCFIYQSKYKNTSILTNSKVWVSELAPHSPHNLVQRAHHWQGKTKQRKGLVLGNLCIKWLLSIHIVVSTGSDSLEMKVTRAGRWLSE